MSERVLLERVIGEEGLEALAGELLGLLARAEPFVLWLDGPMGAGKSTLVRHYLWAAGLDPRVPVVSPTYTIMNEYQVGERWYAHLDLYRAEANFSLDELGVRDARSYAGMFVEWPEVPEGDQLEPTHRLTIAYEGEDKRHYVLMLVRHPQADA